MNEKNEIDKDYFKKLLRDFEISMGLIVRQYYVINPCTLIPRYIKETKTFEIISFANEPLGFNTENWFLMYKEIRLIAEVMQQHTFPSKHCKEQWEKVWKQAKEILLKGGEEPENNECPFPAGKSCKECKLYNGIDECCMISVDLKS